MEALGCSVKTPRQNDVSSVRPRSESLQLRYSGDNDARDAAQANPQSSGFADEFVR